MNVSTLAVLLGQGQADLSEELIHWNMQLSSEIFRKHHWEHNEEVVSDDLTKKKGKKEDSVVNRLDCIKFKRKFLDKRFQQNLEVPWS